MEIVLSRHTYIVRDDAMRQKLAGWIMKIPFGWRVEMKEPKRSTEQNAKLWANLTEIAAQVKYHGVKLSPEDYKLLFISSLFRDRSERMRLVPNLEGNGFVALGGRSSDLSVSEMRDLIELTEMYAAQNGVVFQSKQGQE
jgi:NinB protein.